MKVYLHTKNKGATEWDNTELEFGQLPARGEYLVLKADSEYYAVRLVVHTPYEKGAFDAEIWAEEVSQADAMRQTIHEVTE